MAEQVSLSERFAKCTFTPITKDVASFSPITASAEASWKCTSYYLDSSGRSTFQLPLQLGCSSKEDLDHIIASGCLRPKNIQEESPKASDFAFRLEAQCHGIEWSQTVTAEGITIQSCTVEGNSILLETEVVVRATSQSVSDSGAHHSSLVTTRLEVTAVLTQHKKHQQSIASGLLALELGGGSMLLSGGLAKLKANETRSKPISIQVTLTHALTISVKNVGGASHGTTLVSLTMSHSNTHSDPVTITNIALHPGLSRQDAFFVKDRSMPGGGHSVTDMSKYVQWKYAPRTEPQLPLTLHPHDAYSTVITVHAGDDVRSRTFRSPLSVTATVGTEPCRPKVVAAADAHWTTGRVALEPTDAFRIEMSVAEHTCRVGDPVVVSSRIVNLSQNTRDLMLLMAKDDEKVTEESVQNAVIVSKMNGYTFGVWGLSGDGTELQSNDKDLLAVDAALLLGELKGQQSVDVQLRFVPLKEGTLDVPNFMLYDRTEGEWYSCDHKLRLVAAAKRD